MRGVQRFLHLQGVTGVLKYGEGALRDGTNMVKEVSKMAIMEGKVIKDGDNMVNDVFRMVIIW